LASERAVGIVSCGMYIPWNRLRREDVAREWDSQAGGEKAVASYDEDSLTMAVEATRNCFRANGSPVAAGAVYFCSTTSPYLEKQSSATIAEVFELPDTTMTVDIADTLRAGTQGIILGSDAIRAGRIQKVLVCASDRRLCLPNGSSELAFGDGAAAFCLGQDDVIAVIEGIFTTREEIISTWRSDRDRYVRTYEERFGLEMGYNRSLPRAIAMALKATGLAPKDFAKVVLYAANPRHVRGVAGKLGFDLETQVQDSLFATVGNAGAAQVPLSLAAALEKASPGDRLLVASYGDGCDVLILKVTEQIRGFQEKCLEKCLLSSHFLKNKRYLPYVKYMNWREILPTEPPLRVPPETPSAAALWRDNASLALKGTKCEACGTVQYPPFRVCVECGAKDRGEPYRLADKVGRLVAFSHDNLAASPDKPTTITVVDFEGGGRVMCDATDRDPKEIKVGMPIEMTFRVLRSTGGIYDYWWKAKPVRG
jgi:hydroxymethylglutaryl-CoA synthase